MFGKSFSILVSVTLLAGASAHSARFIEGSMVADGCTGVTDAIDHQWGHEIPWCTTPGDATVAGMLYRPTTPGWKAGWFRIEPPGGFPAGEYRLFSAHMGSSVAFDFSDEDILVASGTQEIKNQIFRTHAHYSVMYDRDSSEWGKEPWLWGTVFYQTFLATSRSLNRVSVRLAGKGGDHATLFLNYAVMEVTDASPSSWTQVGPTKTFLLPGTMDPIIHHLPVSFRSEEVPLEPGKMYALKLWVGDGSTSPDYAVVCRSTSANGGGYEPGCLYRTDEQLPDLDLYGYFTGGPPNTLVNVCPPDPVNPAKQDLLGWAQRWGQTFVASGTGLGGVEFMYTVGCDPNSSLPVKICLYDKPGGSQIGPTKTCHSVTDLCQGRAAAYFFPGECPLVAGQTYYIEFDASGAGGTNAWPMNGQASGQAWQDRQPLEVDLPVLIAEYREAAQE